MINHNLNQFNQKLSKIANKSPEIADVVVLEATTEIVNNLKDRSPVDTGNLRSNWRQEKLQTALRQIFNDTEYILDTEFATKSPHRGWIEKTLQQVTDGLEKKVEKSFQDLLR